MLQHFKKDVGVWSDNRWAEFRSHADAVNKSIAALIEQGETPDSDPVQALIHEHYVLQENFFNLTREVYLALIQMHEEENPEMERFFQTYHPNMRQFMCKAMKHYAEKQLCQNNIRSKS